MTGVPPSILSPKNDYVFKQLFGDSTRIAPLADFLQAALELSPDEFVGLAIVDPNLNPETGDDKHCILDVRVTTRSGRDIDVEIQVEPTDELCDRIQYYIAKMVTEKVKSGDSYKDMPQSVSIVILDYRLWMQSERYHHRFRLYDPKSGLEYPNSMEINTLELPKRPLTSDGSGLWNWLAFLSSRTREEFDSLAGKGLAMAEAVARLMELSADEKARTRADARDKWLWDQTARERKSLREERGKIARRLLGMKMPFANIASATGLSEADVERLAKEG